ncbi:hypothetical protein MBLNU459_g5250t1 [Dothideomycetes sp. NU459]
MNQHESKYRIRMGNEIKYLTIAPQTLYQDALGFPLPHLTPLPYHDDNWTVAHVSPNYDTLQPEIWLSDRELAAVKNVWHSSLVNILDLQLDQPAVFETVLPESVKFGVAPGTTAVAPPSAHQPPSQTTVIAKIACFESDIPRIERETRIYQVLQERQGASELVPRFLGHLHEGGRVMGLLLENLEGWRPVSIEDLTACKRALANFHDLGLLHGDVKCNHYLEREGEVKLVDFQHSQESASPDLRIQEMQSLEAALMDTSGRDEGMFLNDSEE